MITATLITARVDLHVFMEPDQWIPRTWVSKEVHSNTRGVQVQTLYAGISTKM